MGRKTLLTIIVAQAMGLGMLGMAAGDREGPGHRDREPASVTRLNSGSAPKSKITGTLSCEMAAENTGQACQLKLLEAGTGKQYEINGSNDAMRLFQDGKREVAIVGRPSGDQLRVISIEAL